MRTCKVCGNPILDRQVKFCSMDCRVEYGAYLPSIEEIYREARRLRELRPYQSPEDDRPVEIKIFKTKGEK